MMNSGMGNSGMGNSGVGNSGMGNFGMGNSSTGSVRDRREPCQAGTLSGGNLVRRELCLGARRRNTMAIEEKQ